MKSKKGSNSTKRTEDSESSEREVPFIAGIGASAGGLEAISTLLEQLPSDLEIVYVVIQHLDPYYDSILHELLGKKTQMEVTLVKNKMILSPNHVYVIPPNTFMKVEKNTLILVPRMKYEGVFHPIDYFLTSLASTYFHRSIGIILSGTASDGTMGLKAIKAAGGITFAQDDSAKYQEMPQNALNSGYVDFLLSPARIAKDLTALAKYPGEFISSKDPASINANEIHQIIGILNKKRKVDFSSYKKNSVQRRIMRRMSLNHMDNLNDYAAFLESNVEEIELLYKDLLINVSSFFRDPSIYLSLSKLIFPDLFKNKKNTDSIRIWVPGCAMGEEACSIAITLIEFLAENSLSNPIQIFATDLSLTTIEKARLGIYSKEALENVSPERLKRFFLKANGSYQVVKSVRDSCIYAPHNLLKDPPFSHMDLISCQNVLIYLDATPQKKVLQTFHHSLNPYGYLLLGKSETIGQADDLFEPTEKNLKIFTKKNLTAVPKFERHYFSNRDASKDKQNELPQDRRLGADIEKETDKLLLARYAPASLVINNNMEIVRFRGSTSLYLNPSAGKASFQLFKIIKDDLVFELKSLISKAKKEGNSVKKEEIILKSEFQTIELTIEVIPLHPDTKESYFLIVFKENLGTNSKVERSLLTTRVKNKAIANRQITDLEQKLKDAWDHISTMNEAFETTQNDLQTANEEVLSANEELQSINEELETSKEELQSTNEELTSINEELQHRNTDLKSAMGYTEAIVQTIMEPLIVLNENMQVITANKAFYDSYQLSEADTEDKNFFEIGGRLWNIPELRNSIHESIAANKNFKELEIRKTFPGKGAKILQINVSQLIQEDRKIRILLAIHDITITKLAEDHIKESEEQFRKMADNAPMMIWMSDLNDYRIYFNNSWLNYTGIALENQLGKKWHNCIHPDDLERYLILYNGKYESHQKFTIEYRLMGSDGTYHWILESGICMHAADKSITFLIGSCMDINEKIELEHRKDEFISIASHELKTPVTSVKAYTQLLQQELEIAGDLKSVAILGKMDVQLDRLNNLIRDLLDVTKIAQGNLQFNKTSFDMNDLINSTIDEMQSILQNHIIVKRFKFFKKVYGDKDRISQVINNLLSNAIKYSPVAKEIIVSSIEMDNEVTISVKDKGIGITKEAKSRVFERFFRIEDQQNKFPGLGLGLYIASEIIRYHNGHIGVKSELGKGSTFYFSLPLKKV